MCDIQKSQITKKNFFAGDFPIVTDCAAVEDGAKIRAHTPIASGDDGVKETAPDTLDALIGISAAQSSGSEIAYYLTGEFFANALTLPDGVTVGALKPALRKLSIFLREGGGSQ
jgi:hypothetical protein